LAFLLRIGLRSPLGLGNLREAHPPLPRIPRLGAYSSPSGP
jgi:hypothetical protein